MTEVDLVCDGSFVRNWFIGTVIRVALLVDARPESGAFFEFGSERKGK